MQGLVKMNDDGTWAEDRYNPLYYMVHVAKVALPLYPQFGTEPNGYYIPPRWVPRDYLKQMFGPGVDAAIERYTYPDRELLAVLQLFRRSNRIIFRYEVKEGPKIYEATLRGRQISLYNDTVIAYGQDGKEIFRTQVEEPVHDTREPKAKHLIDKFKETGASAVLILAAKFCEPALFDYALYKRALEKEGIPHLCLEFEEKMWIFDKARTEVETFVESMLFD